MFFPAILYCSVSPELALWGERSPLYRKYSASGTVRKKTLLTKLPGTFDIVTAERDWCGLVIGCLIATTDAEFFGHHSSLIALLRTALH